MPHRVIETIQNGGLVLIGGLIAAMGRVYLLAADALKQAVSALRSEPVPTQETIETAKAALNLYEAASWALLPAIGAFVSCSCCVMLAPPRNKWEAAGRGTFGIFVAICLTQLMKRYQLTNGLAQYPEAQLLLGSSMCLFMFWVSKPLILRIKERSDGYADDLVEVGETKLGLNHKKDNEQDH